MPKLLLIALLGSAAALATDDAHAPPGQRHAPSGRRLAPRTCPKGQYDAGYTQKTSGSCAAPKAPPIATKAACEAAAAAQGLSDLTADSVTDALYPPGCFSLPGILYYNDESSSTAPCTSAQKCLCVSSDCTPCPRGTFASAPGARTTCSSCAAGKASPKSGSASSADCVTPPTVLAKSWHDCSNQTFRSCHDDSICTKGANCTAWDFYTFDEVATTACSGRNELPGRAGISIDAAMAHCSSMPTCVSFEQLGCCFLDTGRAGCDFQFSETCTVAVSTHNSDVTLFVKTDILATAPTTTKEGSCKTDKATYCGSSGMCKGGGDDAKTDIGNQKSGGCGEWCGESLVISVLAITACCLVYCGCLQRTLPRNRIPAGDTPASLPPPAHDDAFVPSALFEGARKGFDFKTGAQGCGYYQLDAKFEMVPLAASSALA